MEFDNYINKWCDIIQSQPIPTDLYAEYSVLRGLRDVKGKGVRAGLTQVSNVMAATVNELGETVPAPGSLKYRGVDIKDLINGCINEKRFGFEECAYLLLLGKLPTEKELLRFKETLANYRTLPVDFLDDIILRTPCKDMMNTLSRGVLALYTTDDNPDDISAPNLLRQSLQLIAKFPLIAVYGYQSYKHHFEGDSLIIHNPDPTLSASENILRLLRADSQYTPLEAHVLDVCLMLHMEHGGGNNSTFTNRVVSSSGTDTYSAITASLASLKGPRHGGANIKVVRMFDDLKEHVKNTNDDGQVADYLKKLLDKNAFDKRGLIYGMGHAVYGISDPRAEVLEGYAKLLCEEKGYVEDFELYQRVARLAKDIINNKRQVFKGVCANVDFYSGLVYKMLNIPYELYTPLFAVARVVGWCAHRMEELLNESKIIRPAYKSIHEIVNYTPLDERKK